MIEPVRFIVRKGLGLVSWTSKTVGGASNVMCTHTRTVELEVSVLAMHRKICRQNNDTAFLLAVLREQ